MIYTSLLLFYVGRIDEDEDDSDSGDSDYESNAAKREVLSRKRTKGNPSSQGV